VGRIFPYRRASPHSSYSQIGVQGIGRRRWNRACSIRHEVEDLQLCRSTDKKLLMLWVVPEVER
jgi:hypothetical protein